MADFTSAFDALILAEGGFVLTDKASDRGGQTYAGIARRWWPRWAGWPLIDRGEAVPPRLVIEFYRAEFWLRISGDQITRQPLADALLLAAVVYGPAPAVILAQRVLSVAQDGVVGRMTLFALNSCDADLFLARFALAQCVKFANIATIDKSQQGNLPGWINRAAKGVL